MCNETVRACRWDSWEVGLSWELKISKKVVVGGSISADESDTNDEV